jgi:hypothetical protein
MWRDAVFQGFFHTPLWQNRSPATTIALRSITTDSPARIMKHEENNSSGPVTFPPWLTAPAAVGSPLPRLRDPYLHPPLWSSRLALGEVDAHFLGIWRGLDCFAETRDSQPGSLNHGIQTGAISPGGRRAATFPIAVWGKQTSQNEHFWFWTQLET